MCLSPIPIPEKGGNIRYEISKKGVNSYTGKTDKYGIHKLKYMLVPCGHCKQCIAIAQMELIERIQMEAMSNTMYMVTLTYNQEMLPIITTSTGFDYRYARYEDLTECLKRVRDNNLFGIPFKYFAVTERGGKRQRPHFHIILSFKNEDIGYKYFDKFSFQEEFKWKFFEEWKRKVGGGKRYCDYKPLCDYRESYRGRKLRRTYDFHYIEPRFGTGITDAAFYVLKYMLKQTSDHEEKIRQALKLNCTGLPTPEQKEHWWEQDTEDLMTEGELIWQIVKSRRKYSLGFGLGVDYNKLGKDRTIKEENCDQKIIEYLQECIETSKKSKTEYAYYYCPENLSTFPLANYYKKYGFIYNAEDEDYFYNLNPQKYRDRYLQPEHLNRSELEHQIHDFQRILKTIEMEEVADDFDELLNN